MKRPLMRIPYTSPLPAPRIIPQNANTSSGAISALHKFVTADPAPTLHPDTAHPESTVVITGAGISVASGLADYRGDNGTYRVNKTYRPIYYHEFLESHAARRRYWARSMLGWPTLEKAKPNATHFAIKDLGELGILKSVITQNVDSFHVKCHPQLPTLELHGYLRATRCVTCHSELPRGEFQEELARLNPAWAAFLETILASGALNTEDPGKRNALGMKQNADGDVDLPGAPYSTFRYPPCPRCLTKPPLDSHGKRMIVEIDSDGALTDRSNAGILKPAVVMFGESIASIVKEAAEHAIDSCGRLLIVGTSLATYSAWRLAKRAQVRGMPIGIVNLGGVRGEEHFFEHLSSDQRGQAGVRIEMSSTQLLPGFVDHLRSHPGGSHSAAVDQSSPHFKNAGDYAFKDMLS